MTAYSLRSGRFTSSVTDAWYTPRLYDKRHPVVVYMSGAGTTPTNGFQSAKPTLDALVAEGYCVVQPNVNPLFGNSTAMTRISDAVTWAQANLPVTTSDPIMVGISNGGICSFQYARQNQVTCVVTVIMPIDLENIRAGDLGSLRSSIDTAWGVTYPAALPSHADLLTDQDAYIGKPAQMWLSTNDPLDNTATGHSQAEFAAHIGADTHSLGAVGHADSSWSTIDVRAVVEFVKARG